MKTSINELEFRRILENKLNTKYFNIDVNTITKSEELRSKNISYRRQYDQDTLIRIYRP